MATVENLNRDSKHNRIMNRLHGIGKAMDMTQGNIFRLLISFAIPLMLGNLFQLLYNTVDTFVVGNYVSDEAYKAVGNVNPIINTLVGFFSGLATGAGVVISQYFGAKDEKNVKKAVHTTMIMTLALGVLFTFAGIAMTPYMLSIINFAPEIIPDATEYLTIYFAGVIGLMIYNIGSGILRAVGDTGRPFIFLVICALLNVALDLLFVLAFDMKVAGVAYATIISQFISAILVMITLMRSKECYKVSVRDLKCDFRILKKIISVGLPAAIQMTITAFSNVFVQSYLMGLDARYPDFSGGWTSYLKIDQFVLLPAQTISLASTTFVGQNLGAGNTKRAKTGANLSLLLSVIVTAVILVPVLLFAPQIVWFFNKNEMIIKYGAELLRAISPFYLIYTVNQIYAGALRGAGKSTAPTVIMIASFVVFRQIYLAVISRITDTYMPIAMAYPVGWVLCSIVMYIYYRCSHWEKYMLIGDDEAKKSEPSEDRN